MRRKLIYLLIDTSESMKGKSLEVLINSLKRLIDGLRNEPQALETAYLSVIKFGGNAKKLEPLTDLLSFELPPLELSGDSVLGLGLKLLNETIDEDMITASEDKIGDFIPIVIIFTNSKPVDLWHDEVEVLHKKARIILCTVGHNEDMDVLIAIRRFGYEVLNLLSDDKKAIIKLLFSTNSDYYNTRSIPVTATLRKLPLYLLIDVSDSMKGEPLKALQNGIWNLVTSLINEINDFSALETVHLSIITFGGTSQTVVPLTKISEFAMPRLIAGGARVLGEALELLDKQLEVEVKRPSKDNKGDWKPLIYLMIDGNPADNWVQSAKKIKKRDVTVVACLSGSNDNKNLYKQLTENVVERKSASRYDFAKYFRWEDQKLVHSVISPLKSKVEKKNEQTEQNSLHGRRLPIYLLIDASESTQGFSLDALRDGIIKFVSDLRSHPFYLESAYISIITCSEIVEQILPLTDILTHAYDIIALISTKIRDSKSSHLKEGIEYLCHIIDVDVIKGTAELKGDFHPICFLVTDEMIGDERNINDNWVDLIKSLTQKHIDVMACSYSSCGNMGVHCAEVIFHGRDEIRTDDELFYQIPVRSEADQKEQYKAANKKQNTAQQTTQDHLPSNGKTRTATATDGQTIEYISEIIGYGGMMDVYSTTDKKYVVSFYKRPTDEYTLTQKRRLEVFVEKYSPSNDLESGGYWKELFYFPEKYVSDGGKYGFLARTYPDYFFFEAGPMKGKEKEGKWFASPKLRKILDPTEKGTWLSYFQISILLSRAIRRMHTSGLAHSDLSYRNVLIDPKGGHAAIVGFNDIVIPGRYPPDILGTAGFIAPEVYKTLKFNFRDKNRVLPSRYTDLHALAVLIYMYLLYRHPLRGGKVHDLDPGKDEELSMGENALFIEHPTDKSNRPKENDPAFMPWADVNQIPYTITGPYLKTLFDQAFIDGLHNPARRPLSGDWEEALVKTVDLMQPCGNEKCEQKWFVFDNTTQPKCPFCGWKFKGSLPILNFYLAKKKGGFTPDNHRLMVYNNQYLYPWHVNRKIFPNEKLTPNEKKPVGYFVFHQGRWVLVNQTLPNMKDVTENKEVPIGTMVELKDGKQILLSREDGGRLAFVQIVKA